MSKSTYRYYCKECNCGLSEKGMPEFHIEKTDDDESPEICENGTNPPILYQVGKITSIHINKFSGKLTSTSSRTKKLKERASVHFKKEIKERKHQMWKDTFNKTL